MGGTRKWCPRCECLHQIKIIPGEKQDGFTSKTRNFWLNNGSGIKEDMIHYFLRRAKCLNCEHEWNTAEFNYTELVFLISFHRDLFAENCELKEDAEVLESSYEIALDGNKTRDEAIEILEGKVKQLVHRNTLLENLNKSRMEKLKEQRELIEELKSSLVEVTLDSEQKRGELRELTIALRVIMKYVEIEEA